MNIIIYYTYLITFHVGTSYSNVITRATELDTNCTDALKETRFIAKAVKFTEQNVPFELSKIISH